MTLQNNHRMQLNAYSECFRRSESHCLASPETPSADGLMADLRTPS